MSALVETKGEKRKKNMEPQYLAHAAKGRFPLGEMSGDFAAKYIWLVHFYLFVVGLAKYFSSK